MTTTMHTHVDDAFYAVLMERFSQNSIDSMWYPLESGDPLVRVAIENGTYRIDRRAEVNQPWMQLVVGLNAEFDAESFAKWADTFMLTS